MDCPNKFWEKIVLGVRRGEGLVALKKGASNFQNFDFCIFYNILHFLTVFAIFTFFTYFTIIKLFEMNRQGKCNNIYVQLHITNTINIFTNTIQIITVRIRPID